MRSTAGTLVLMLLGLVLFPLCLVAVVFLPRRDGQGWRPQPPMR